MFERQGYVLATLPDPCVKGSINTMPPSLTVIDRWKQHSHKHKGPSCSPLAASNQAHPTELCVFCSVLEAGKTEPLY